jgi:DNA-directed RNA polymerase III subunit RPC4
MLLVKVEDGADGMEGVTPSSEGTPNGQNNDMHIDEVADSNAELPFEDERLYFFQLPAILPRFKVPIDEPAVKGEAEDVEMKEQPSTIKMEKEQEARRAPKVVDVEFDKAQEGRIGSLLVYKSGKVKLKLGSVLMEVAPGTDPSFLENVVVVDSKDQTRTSAVSVGNITEKFLCVPDIDSLLS